LFYKKSILQSKEKGMVFVGFGRNFLKGSIR